MQTTVTGTIPIAAHRTNSNGQSFAEALLTNSDGALSVLFFPKIYGKRHQLITKAEGTTKRITITGRLDQDESRTVLFAHDAREA